MSSPSARRARFSRRRMEVFRRDNWTCWICGYQTPELFRRKEFHNNSHFFLRAGGHENPVPLERRMTVDHVRPRSKGGTDALANLLTACKSCNNRRGSRSAEDEWCSP